MKTPTAAQQANYWAPLTCNNTNTHPHGPTSHDVPAHFIWGRTDDCPAPLKKTKLPDDPRSTSHSRGTPSTGRRARTNEATCTRPMAEQTMTQLALRREERVTVQGPVRRPEVASNPSSPPTVPAPSSLPQKLSTPPSSCPMSEAVRPLFLFSGVGMCHVSPL